VEKVTDNLLIVCVQLWIAWDNAAKCGQAG